MARLSSFAAALCAASIAGSSAFAASQTAEYFARYDGTWSGTGSVSLEQLDEPANVSCTFDGSSEGNETVSLDGSCRAMIVFSRDIDADLAFDPATETYSGSYTGSDSGPAKLRGKRNGDVLDLEVTWGKEIHGDNKARMTIRNEDGEAFRMIVTDRIDGEPVEVSNISFDRP